MSSAISSPAQVTSNTPILVTTTTNDTGKQFVEHNKRDDSSDDQRQPLNRQNKSYSRGNSNKNKQLTRSHAMKESASPPRTPNSSHSPIDMKSHSPTAPTLLTSDESQQSPSSAQHLSAPTPTFVLPQSETHGGKSQLDIEFPKLTPPKTKVGWNASGGSRNNRKSVSSDTSSNNNSLCEDVNESHDKAAQQQQYKSGSQTISISPSASINHHLQSPQSDRKQRQQQLSCENEYEKGSTDSYNPNEDRSMISPSRSQCKSPSYPHNDNYNHNNNSNANGGSKSINTCSVNVKGKPPLKNMGSSSSFEGGNTSSGFISRDSSSEQFVDQNGIDLVQFFKETLNKNAKDRNMLMKIERELLQLAVDQTGRTFIKFPPMSSYNRMLVHRTAAYFGMDHNVDSTQQSVIASTTKDTRIPEIRFKTLIRDTFSEEPRRSILKRETHSFEDYRQGGLLSVQRSILHRKAKSFEERDEENEKEWQWIHDGGGEISNKLKVPIRLMKIHNQTSMDGRYEERNSFASKSHSFGSYGQNPSLSRDDSINSNKSTGSRFHKQDSTTSTTWRLSPSSSGYKTQSLRSDSVTPSPTGGYETPELHNQTAQSPDGRGGVVWAVTDLASVPKGSLIIDPSTLQPILNQDGSLYHYDPSNPPATIRYNTRKKSDRQKTLNNNGKPNTRESTTNNNFTKTKINGDAENSAAIIIESKYSKTNQSTNNIVENEDDTNDEEEKDEYELPQNNNVVESFVEDESCKTKDENCENESSQCELKSLLSAEESMSPKQKNQSTSPNLPINEMIINEEEESVTPTSSIQPSIEMEGNIDTKRRKDEIASFTETSPVHEIRFQTNPYTQNAAAASTPTMPPVLSYASAPPFTTPLDPGAIYHTGPDGTLYVLSQPVMYSYTTTSTDNEVSSCWVPISFDQGARDPNLTVLPVATPYNGPALYQGPVVYSTEQFTNPPAIAGQVTQYPVGAAYPMGYATYPVNGASYQNIWPQPMTYFLPPSAATPAPTPLGLGTQTPNAAMIQSTTSSNTQNPSTNSNTIGRRNSPSTNNSANNAQSTTMHTISTQAAASAVPLQTFSSSVPFSIATATESNNNGPAAIYALPSSMYPNVLPYPAPTTGFYQPLPHPQANTTIISSVIPHTSAHQPAAASTVPSTPHSFQASSSGEIITTHFPFNQQTPNNGGNSNNNNNINNSTPQSTPSTPLSLTTVTTNLKNPPLFATPPIIATTTQNPMHIVHYDDKKGGPRKSYNNGPPQSYSSHPKQGGSNMNNQRQGTVSSGYHHPNSNGGMQNKKNNVVGAIASNNSHNEDTSSSLSNNNMSSNYNASNRVKSTPNRDQGGYQPKPFYNKNQHQNSNNGSPNSNDNSEAQNYGQKYPSRGPARIPPLDLKRNNSNASMVQNHHHSRSTPSTNSAESNNSPNSITSYDHSRPYQYSHHQQTSYGAANGGTFYRGGSAGTINQNVHHNPNNNVADSTQIQTCFPFNVHSQNPGTSTPLLDSCHPQTLIGYNNPMTAGMYVKFGQAFTFANPLPNSRKSPSSDIRAPLAPLAGVYSTMMLPGGPRPRAVQNQNYKGNRSYQR